MLDSTLPLFHRAYAWYRLTRHWASLRFHDTSGMPPATMARRARGLVGVLERTKTSGADKGTRQLPVFVSDEAFINHPWLWPGLKLWEEELGFPRDYFLVLPNRDLSGTCGKRARYSDAVGFSRQLFAALKTPSGDPLLLPESLSFWTEHSDRCGVDSCLAALGVGEDLRGFVGRWGVKGAADTYVRTALRVTENLQRLVARHGRLSWAHGPDYFGEEHILAQLEACLQAQGVSEADIAAQLERLQTADPSRRDTAPFGQASATGALVFDEEPSAGDGVMVPEQAVVAAEELAFPSLNDEDPKEEEFEEALAALALPALKAAPRGFIIAVTQRGRLRRVHYGGGCFRKPGEHYLDWEELGDRAPEPHEFNARCLHCFPQDRQLDRDKEAGDESDVGSASSSDSAQLFPEVAEGDEVFEGLA